MNSQLQISPPEDCAWFKVTIVSNNVTYQVFIPKEYRFIEFERKKINNVEVIGIRARKILSHKGRFFKARKLKV